MGATIFLKSTCTHDIYGPSQLIELIRARASFLSISVQIRAVDVDNGRSLACNLSNNGRFPVPWLPIIILYSPGLQSDLAITNLDIADTLLYWTPRNLNGAHQPISPCYNGHTMYTGPDRFFKIYNPCYHRNNICCAGWAGR